MPLVKPVGVEVAGSAIPEALGGVLRKVGGLEVAGHAVVTGRVRGGLT